MKLYQSFFYIPVVTGGGIEVLRVPEAANAMQDKFYSLMSTSLFIQQPPYGKTLIYSATDLSNLIDLSIFFTTEAPKHLNLLLAAIACFCGHFRAKQAKPSHART